MGCSSSKVQNQNYIDNHSDANSLIMIHRPWQFHLAVQYLASVQTGICKRNLRIQMCQRERNPILRNQRNPILRKRIWPSRHPQWTQQASTLSAPREANQPSDFKIPSDWHQWISEKWDNLEIQCVFLCMWSDFLICERNKIQAICNPPPPPLIYCV